MFILGRRIQLSDGDGQILQPAHQSVQVLVIGLDPVLGQRRVNVLPGPQLEVQLGQTLLLIPQPLHLLHAAALAERPQPARIEVVHQLEQALLHVLHLNGVSLERVTLLAVMVMMMMRFALFVTPMLLIRHNRYRSVVD